MKFTYKHAGLIAGMLLILLSFLFFAGQKNIGSLLLGVGIVTVVISYGAILFKKGTISSKLGWTFVLIILFLGQLLAGPLLLDISYRQFILKYGTELDAVNRMLKEKQGDIEVINETVRDNTLQLNETEKTRLVQWKKTTGVTVIHKTADAVFYGLSSEPDTRLGFRYLFSASGPDPGWRKLNGNWYR